MTIDHVIADRRIRIAAYDVVPITGTDHNAVFAELLLPASAAPGARR